jgi:AcrR family transcriptional regulator
MDAAVRVFAERGSDATLNDIARAAGVGVGTVYRKFADKEAMLDALFDEKIEALVDLAVEASTLTDAGAAVRQLLFGVMSKRASDRGLDAILMAPGRSSRFAEELGQRFIPAVDRLVARAIEAGELRADFSAQEVCILAFMVGKVADITRETDPAVWRRYAQMLIDGTRHRDGDPPLVPGPLSFEENAAALGRGG